MKFANKFKINNRTISLNHPTYFIADIGANHDGSLKRAKELIWLAKNAGADAVKFQHFLANKIVSDFGFKKLGKIGHQNNWKISVFDMYEKCSLNRNWNLELINEAKKAKIDWFTTPYDFDAIKNLNKYLAVYKIGSGDITWINFLKFIATKKKPIVIAAGASTMKDVTRAINSIKKINNKICLMQCNTNYTGSLKNFNYINLNVLNTFKKEFKNIILGLSDHTPGHTTVLGAISLGARMIEKHFTDNNKRNGPDHPFAMNYKTWKKMVERSRELEQSLGNGIKIIEKNEAFTHIVQRRSIRANKDLKKGKKISSNDLEFLRPSPRNSLKPYDVKKILGKKLKKDKKRGSEFYINDLN